MPKPPRDLSDAPGLGPLSPPGPPQPVDELRVDWLRSDMLAALPDDVRALVVGPAMDMITQGRAKGASDHVLLCLRGMLRRVVRGLYDVEVRRSGGASLVDVDPTVW